MDVSPIKDRSQTSSLPSKIKREDDRNNHLESVTSFLPMENILHPTNQDVLCGRGVTTNRHKGNESFRALVNCNKELYVSSTKKNKMNISRSIVEAVRSKDPTPGRFLEKNSNGTWFDIGDKKAIEKTSQALRDGAAHLRKQLSEDLSDPDFLNAVFSDDKKRTKTTENNNTTKPTINNNNITSANIPTNNNNTAAKITPPKKKHRRTKSDPVGCLNKLTPIAETSHLASKVQDNMNDDFSTPSSKIRKCGEHDMMMIKHSNSFNSPMNPPKRVTPEEPRALPQGRVFPPHNRTNNALTNNNNNTRHRRNHTMTGPYNVSDGINPDCNASMNETLMQESTNHAFHATERPGGYHPASPYIAHSSPGSRAHSPYRPPHPPHASYAPPLSPNVNGSNSPYHHSHSPTLVQSNSPYRHHAARPIITRTNSNDSNRSNSPYHPPPIPLNSSNNNANRSSYQFPIINRSDSHDSYHQKTNTNAYRPPFYQHPHSPPLRPNINISSRSNINALNTNDMRMPDINADTRYPDNTYTNQMHVSFRNGALSQNPTSPRNYNNLPPSRVNNQPLLSPPHPSRNNANYTEPLRARYGNNNYLPNHNNHHDNNIHNQQNIPPNEKSMMLTEEDDTISDYDDLKMINPLPFNMDYQRERTISENTLIGLQHL